MVHIKASLMPGCKSLNVLGSGSCEMAYLVLFSHQSHRDSPVAHDHFLVASKNMFSYALAPAIAHDARSSMFRSSL